MERPQDRKLEDLLADSLMEWTRVSEGWKTATGESVSSFRPTMRRDDAGLLVRRMEELGFRFEDRRVESAPGGGAVLASFYRGSQVFSALAQDEGQAICTAASRFVMHRAGERVPAEEEAAEKTAAGEKAAGTGKPVGE